MSTNLDLINEFNNRIPLLQQLYYDRGVLKKEVRSYEVSLWTLLDEFITVLKWSDVEQKGRIESPMLTINVDGTLRFTFSIPAQYNLNGVLQDNPNWYTVQTGQLIMGLRKVKVIFNKGEEYEVTDEEELARIRSSNVFELVITKVTEDHENDLTRCEVECEGLAFHELGKVGYKLSLSQENFELDREEYDTNGYWIRYDNSECDTEPNETVQYWCEEGCHLSPRPVNRAEMNASQWYYDILMNWGSFSDMPHRAPDKIYEEEYVSSWDSDLKPTSIETFREKARPVEASESNLYNITQNIAETFGIYCRYEYGYDDNYHIISRQVIFYNSYFDETNMISFTYPYSMEKVSRELDSTDVTTKMYVRAQNSDVVASGQITIADCPANRMKEDYLLNFDYMKLCGAINDEQYNYIPVFEKKVRELNEELESLSLQIAAKEEERIENEALANVAKNSIALDLESIDYNTELYKRLDASDGVNDGYFSRVPANPYSTYIREREGSFYIPLSTEDKGVINTQQAPIYIYRYYQASKQTFKNRITDFTVINDKYGYPTELRLNNFEKTFTVSRTTYTFDVQSWSATGAEDEKYTASTSNSMLVYLLYKYKPELYYDKVNQVWLTKLAEDQAEYDRTNGIATTAKQALDELYEEQNAKLAEKAALIKHFEQVMGPALREGYWQPDDYSDYGDKKTEILSLTDVCDESVLVDSARNEENNTYSVINWDEELFDGEDDIYYEEGALRDKVYYPCIAIDSSLMSKIEGWYEANQTISFIFNNNYYKDLTNAEKKLVLNCTVFALGSQMQFGFIKGLNHKITPVFILTGALSMTEELIAFMKILNKGNPRIGVVTSEIKEGLNPGDAPTAEWTVCNNAEDVGIKFIDNQLNYKMVYPRIKISSTELNLNSIVLKYNTIPLTNYSDYMVLSRVVTRTESSETKAYLEYFITIKPHVFFKAGSYTYDFNLAYTLSNASTCIYLDAQKVMQDSSKPRASYTVSVSALSGNYLKTLYRNLTLIIMINDTKLKFENIFGYISQLELNLDAPWEDEIEVKNYKTKFEDLFTTIVAQTENMRLNEAAVDAVTAGRIPLNEDAVIKMVINNSSLLLDYLNNGLENSTYVKALLADVFTEAGIILGGANSALNEVKSLTLRNAEILSGFIKNVTAEVTPRVINSINQPTNYKVGDIWNELDEDGNIVGRHVATSSSEDSAEGFTRTFDGHLAAIRGASLNIDTVAGTTELLAENQIDIKSGGNVYIAANDKVDIVGNKAVNIGGGTINIAGSTNRLDDESGGYTTGGINIVSSKLDFTATSSSSVEDQIANALADETGSTSKVLIHPTKIEMASANILMHGSNAILMVTSLGDPTGVDTSALSISPDNGIWIGSGAGVRLYSGNVVLSKNTDNDTFEIDDGTGANIELLPQHLLMGVSNTATEEGTAIKMTDEYIILASGNKLHHDVWQENHAYVEGNIVNVNSVLYRCKQNHTSSNFSTELENHYWEGYDADADLEVTGTIGSLVGAKFTATSIGFAIEDPITHDISAILMNDKGITLGSGNFDLDSSTVTLRVAGSAVRIAPTGIDIGSTGHLFISTNNFTIDSSAIDNDPMFNLKYPIKDGNGLITEWKDALLYSQDGGLYVHGNIINDTMALVNSAYSISNDTTLLPGLYLTNNSLTSSLVAVKINGVTYYAWLYNNNTYYTTVNEGTSIVGDVESYLPSAGDIIYTYPYVTNGAAPKYLDSQVVKGYEQSGQNLTSLSQYSYNQYFLVDGPNGLPLLYNGEKIIYDGSNDINSNWYKTVIKLPNYTNYVDEYKTYLTEPELVTLPSGAVLTRTPAEITFSVEANSGMVTINLGLLGDFYVSSSGFSGGTILGGNVSSTKITGCTIEDYTTGYYGRCFYDYSTDMTNCTITFKRIDGHEEVIDIKALVLKALTDSTGAQTVTCTDCSGGCASSCSGSCGSTCKGGCTGSCGGNCVSGCNDTCTGSCSTTCTGKCTTTCTGGCTGSCTGGCGTACSTVCTGDCGGSCGGSCGYGCGSNCQGNCVNSCQGSCSGACLGGCTGSCSSQCSSGCGDGCMGNSGSVIL